MKAIKIRRKISSKSLHINELEKLIGMEAEITILPIEDVKKVSVNKILKFAGTIKTGSDPDDFQKEIRKDWENRV